MKTERRGDCPYDQTKFFVVHLVVNSILDLILQLNFVSGRNQLTELNRIVAPILCPKSQQIGYQNFMNITWTSNKCRCYKYNLSSDEFFSPN